MFSIEYFIGIFGTGPIFFFQSLEAVISSGKVSEGSIAL